MEEGTVVRWLKQTGQEVQRGDALVEIETDKAIMTYEAGDSGILRRLVQEGETVALGEAIAELRTRGDDDYSAESAAETPAERAVAAKVSSSNGSESRPVTSRKRRVPASPVARRLARELGVELTMVTGTGPHGRIVKRDVQAASHAATPQAFPAQDRKPPSGAIKVAAESSKGTVNQISLSRVQSTIARRMSASRATVPDFAIEVDVQADALVALRDQLREAVSDADPLPSYNDFIVKASALALRAFPRVNGAYRDGHVEEYSRVNVGVAVAAEGALHVPVVADADQKSIGTIARETRRLAERGREGALTPAELSGGTFTVSNLGMFGITRFAAVINQPQAAILTAGALERRAVVRDDQVVAAHVVTLTLCADHRILYGADAAVFLAAVRSYLEKPLRLLI
jgi:pyruvate dehydrogenase E2 component (dihydrolipoamide acetyltransferase)